MLLVWSSSAGGHRLAERAVPTSAPVCGPACTSIGRCEAGRCEAACPAGEVFVPSTPKEGFSMGMGEQTQLYVKGIKLPPGVAAFDTPHRVVLTKPFCMDALEVVAKDYDDCVAKGACTATKVAMWTTSWGRHPTLPVNNVDWKQSRAYCKSLGKDLPTEAQWEWAARGDDGRTFPWGNEHPTCEHADFAGALGGARRQHRLHRWHASVGGTHPRGDRIWPAVRITWTSRANVGNGRSTIQRRPDGRARCGSLVW